MSYSTMQAMAGQQQLQHSESTPVQARLRSLVQELKWSYVALWSLNPQTRKLGWKGGHWRQSDAQGWNEQYFSSTFKSCQFRTGCGSVGRAYAKGGNTWMRGSSFLEGAGSKELSEFLQRARISTAIFISWSDGVLELGTCDDLPENLVLMESIRSFFMPSVLPTLGQQGSGHSQLPASNMQTGGVVPQAPLSLPQSSRAMMQASPYASLSPLRHHLPDNLSTQSFEHNSLNQQIPSRLACMPNMFLRVDAEGKEVMNTDNMLLSVEDAAAAMTASWGMQTLITRAAASQTQQTPNQMYYPPVQPRTQPRQTYMSRSDTTSPSVSSLEEAASALLPGDSPEQNVFFMASSQRQPSHSNTSSSPRRGTSSHSPELNQLEDTIGCQSLQETQESPGEDDLTLDPFLMESLESGTYSWPLETGTMSQMNQLLTESTNGNQNYSQNRSQNHGSNAFHGTPSYELPQPEQARSTPVTKAFKNWRRTRILAPPVQKKKQYLLRRCIDMVKQIPHSSPPSGPEGFQNEVQAGMQGRRVTSSSSPETVIDGFPHDRCFDQVPPRVQRRPRQGSRISSMGGAVMHHGHDEAAMNHMMAERRRREKQKENFAALRKLVPIISKADKASILGDAIVYLKGLQSQIKGLEVSKAESERKFETLQNSYKELEQRNREMESMMRPQRLHSL